MLVDSHCHLNCLDYQTCGGSVAEALVLAQKEGVSHFLCVCIDLPHFPEVLAIARDHKDCVRATVGIHPNEPESVVVETAHLHQLAKDPLVIAIGETGLDYFRTQGDTAFQKQRLRQHIDVALATKKPLVIHMREAKDDLLACLKETKAGQVGGIMHCFTEDWATAKKALDLGFYISFSGIVTFKNARALQEVAEKVPSDRMLIETDAPYLAPEPYRGRSNQPAFVKQVALKLAQLRHQEVEMIAEQTTENFFRLMSWDA